jgi:hypothetical protein
MESRLSTRLKHRSAFPRQIVLRAAPVLNSKPLSDLLISLEAKSMQSYGTEPAANQHHAIA